MVKLSLQNMDRWIDEWTDGDGLDLNEDFFNGTYNNTYCQIVMVISIC